MQVRVFNQEQELLQKTITPISHHKRKQGALQKTTYIQHTYNYMDKSGTKTYMAYTMETMSYIYSLEDKVLEQWQ